MKTKISFLSGILLLLSGCAENRETPSIYPVEIETTGFSLPESCGETYSGEEEYVYIINSHEELEKTLLCNEKPPVDFDKHSLLFVYGQTTSGIQSLTHQLFQVSADEYRMDVNMELNDANIVQIWNVAVLTPKLPRNAVIILNKNVDSGETQ